MRGVVLDALNARGRPTPRRLANLGVSGARLVAFDDPRVYSYVAELVQCRFGVAVVLARESFSTDDYASESADYAAKVIPALWILGNEEDAGLLDAESPSSWSMEPDEYAEFFRRAANGILAVQPLAKLVLGGFVAGQPQSLADYLAAIRRVYGGPIEGYDVHPYTKDAITARALLRSYKENAEPGMKAFVMEWNRPAREVPAYVRMLNAHTAGWCWFAWDYAEFGLFTPSGGQRTAYGALKKALREA